MRAIIRIPGVVADAISEMPDLAHVELGTPATLENSELLQWLAGQDAVMEWVRYLMCLRQMIVFDEESRTWSPNPDPPARFIRRSGSGPETGGSRARVPREPVEAVLRMSAGDGEKVVGFRFLMRELRAAGHPIGFSALDRILREMIEEGLAAKTIDGKYRATTDAEWVGSPAAKPPAPGAGPLELEE